MGQELQILLYRTGLRLVFRFKIGHKNYGGKPETFIRKAKLIMVDIDKGEL